MDSISWDLVGWLTTPDGEARAYVGEQAGGWWYRIGDGPAIGPYPSHQVAADAGRAAIGVDGAALLDMLRRQAGQDGARYDPLP